MAEIVAIPLADLLIDAENPRLQQSSVDRESTERISPPNKDLSYLL